MLRHGRVTLIARQSNKPDMDWNYAAARRSSVAFIQTVAAMRYALDAAFMDVDLDIGRVIVDRSGDADAFLELLSALPAEFTGDALFIRDNGTGFLSAAARGGDRVLYALNAHDIRFYLEAHDLVTGRVAMGMTA